MEEQRIGKIYLNLLVKRLQSIWYAIFGRGLRRSPALPWLLILVFVGVPSLGYYLHRRGQFSTFKREIKGQQFAPPPVPSPGGLPAIVLRRTQSPGSNAPELTSVTLLPGLGMDVLQLTASLPGQGEVSLLDNPSVESVADAPTRVPLGLYDTRGAIEAPWGGLLMGQISPLGSSMSVVWHDHSIEVPTEVVARGIDSAGLLIRTPVDSQEVATLPDGASASGSLHATNFDGRWPSALDLKVAVELSASDVAITVSARNTGGTPVPFGAGWHPRFLVQHGGRDGIELHLPVGEQLEIADRTKDQPSGRIVAAAPDLARMQTRAAFPGTESIEATLVHLKPTLLDSVPKAEFRDPGSGYGLRISSPSANTRALRVIAPAGANYVSLGLQTNYDDPLGHEWDGGDGSGIVTLMPGQSFEWRVRLEIFPILKHNAAD